MFSATKMLMQLYRLFFRLYDYIKQQFYLLILLLEISYLKISGDIYLVNIKT